MSPRRRVLVVGDIITDTIVSALRERVDDADTPSVIIVSPGGQGANQAAWLAHAGVGASLIARVGVHDASRHRRHLDALGVGAHLALDGERPSGRIVVIVDHGSGTRHMYTQRGAAAHLHPHDIAAAHVAAASWVHVSGYVLGGVHGPMVMARIMQLAAAAGVPVSLDPASITEIGRIGPEAFLPPGLSAIFANRDELALLSGRADDDEAAVAKLTGRVAIVVAKLGARGAMAATAGGPLIRLPALTVAVADTTGAGDALAGGFLAAHLGGADLETALRRGLELAAVAVSQLGAQPSPSPRR